MRRVAFILIAGLSQVILSDALGASDTSAYAQLPSRESYLCLAEQSTGFAVVDKQWVRSAFHVRDDKFLAQDVPEQPYGGGKMNFVVKRIGSDRIEHRCMRETYEARPETQIRCGGLGYGFQLDTQTLRFQMFYGIGYLDGKDEPGNTPAITIGKCSRLQ